MKTLLSSVALLGAVAFLGGCNSGGYQSYPTAPATTSPTYTTQPAPTYTQPAPTYTQPAPTYTAPAPAPSSGGGTACGAGGKACGK
jgi:hypothetical protein